MQPRPRRRGELSRARFMTGVIFALFANVMTGGNLAGSLPPPPVKHHHPLSYLGFTMFTCFVSAEIGLSTDQV